MTNYNDGKWHGWNGEGEQPVHDKTVVEVILIGTAHGKEASKDSSWADAYNWSWDTYSYIIAFRVLQEYKEPREYWVNFVDERVLPYRDTDHAQTFANEGYTHVREVM